MDTRTPTSQPACANFFLDKVLTKENFFQKFLLKQLITMAAEYAARDVHIRVHEVCRAHVYTTEVLAFVVVSRYCIFNT